MSANDDFVVGHNFGVITSGAIAKEWMETCVRRTIRVDARDAIEGGAIVIVEPTGNENLPIGEQFDVPSPTIQAAAEIETRIARPVGIDPNDAEALHVVVVGEVAGRYNFSVRLNCCPHHEWIRIPIDGDAKRTVAACADIKTRVEPTFGS